MGAIPPDPFDPAIADLVRLKAHRLVGRHGFTSADRRDLEQELAMHFARKQSSFDPTRAGPRTFADRVLQNRAADLARYGDRHPRPASLPRSFDRAAPSLSPQRAALILDVREAVSRLPEHLRRLARSLMENSEADAARLCGYTRQEARTLRQELAHRLQSVDPRARRPQTAESPTSRRGGDVYVHRHSANRLGQGVRP